MLGDLRSSSDAATATAMAAEPFGARESCGGDGGVGSNSGEEDRNNYSRGGGGRGGGGGGEEFGDKSFGGNRWPRQETLALLKIRSDMDVAFRDASVKGPLWDEVSRKLAELGFHRSAKKCKEKFENVYKYHRRTKEGRTGKSDGKTYRFFDQLQALENQPPTPTTPNSATTHQPRPQSTIAMTVNPSALPTISHVNSTVPSAAPHTIITSQGIATVTIPTSLFPPTNPIIFPPPSQPPPQPQPQQNPTSHHHQQSTFISSTDLLSNSTSSSTSSDEEMEGRAKRKRKWKVFFERLMKEVVHKQEDLQKRFLEAIEKREHERMAREEGWRMQELTRIHRESKILAEERSITAAKDAAVMSFLQKISEQQATPTNTNNNLLTPQPPPTAQQSAAPPPPPPRQQPTPPPPALQISQAPITNFEIIPRANSNNGENNNTNNNLVSPSSTTSSSRWPRAEVHSLIKLRTSLDSKYQENGHKGPLWEEISVAMKKLGYNRSAKRCKEKWENINKYFKKVKESNKKRPEDSKTCPYFHLLDSLYRERNKSDHVSNNNNNDNSLSKPENAAPLMVRPEQQWQPPDRVESEMESEPMDQNHEDEDRGDGDEEEDEDDEEDEGNYEIVANKGASVSVSVGTAAAE